MDAFFRTRLTKLRRANASRGNFQYRLTVNGRDLSVYAINHPDGTVTYEERSPEQSPEMPKPSSQNTSKLSLAR